MEKAIEALNVFTNVYRIRIYKLLSKKMLRLNQLIDVLNIDKDALTNHLEILEKTGIIKKLDNTDNPQYFAKSHSSIFDKYAKDICQLISKWFNNNEIIIKDFEKINKLHLK